MADITISIPANQTTAALNAACYALGYQATIEPTPGDVQPNPETKGSFVRRKMAEWFKELVLRGAGEEAAFNARATALASVTNISIT